MKDITKERIIKQFNILNVMDSSNMLYFYTDNPYMVGAAGCKVLYLKETNEIRMVNEFSDKWYSEEEFIRILDLMAFT